MTDLDGRWRAVLEQVVALAAHEVKDALNGVGINLQVISSRLAAGKVDVASYAAFASAATDQFEVLTARTEALLFLMRPHKGGPVDVAATLKSLAAVLVPAAKADGKQLQVEGYATSVPTAASAPSTRLALASGLLGLIKEGGVGRCSLESGPETVVRFSHESAAVGDFDPALASALGTESIRVRRSGKDLHVVFPGNT